MIISVVGVGYVGLVTASCFSSLGNKVICVDKNINLVRKLSMGNVHFFEPNLQDLVSSNLKEERLNFTTNYKNIAHAEIIFVCVDTPPNVDGSPNLKNFNRSINSILKNAKDDALICIKSTVPLGTCRRLKSEIEVFKKAKSSSLEVCSNPEFLKEGNAVNDFLRPDRIIIGSSSSRSRELLLNLYRPLNKKTNKMIFMSPESAELSKYASNAFLATKISFINEMSAIAEHSHADINEVRFGMGSDSRIGNEFLYAGLGFGGSCFPKDLGAIKHFKKKFNLNEGICEATLKVNQRQQIRFINKIKKYYGLKSQSSKLAIWGLSFKPGTDDVRESPAINLVKILSKHFKKLHLYDPVSIKNSKTLLKSITNLKYFHDKFEAAKNTDGLVLCTEWKEFWDPDFSQMTEVKNKIIFDGRNVMNKNSVEKAGYVYNGIGTKL